MSNICGPAGPFMHPDQIFCYSTYTPAKNNNKSVANIINKASLNQTTHSPVGDP